MDYYEQASLKHDAWQQFSREDATFDQKVDALLMVARAHYASSSDGVRRHPPFEEFVRHWVWASMPSFASFQDETVRNELRRRYPKPRVLKIGAGRSTWGSATPYCPPDLGPSPLTVYLASKDKKRNGKRPKHHIMHHLAMCLEATYVGPVHQQKAEIDLIRWGQFDAVTLAESANYVDWKDICKTCLASLKKGLTR